MTSSNTSNKLNAFFVCLLLILPSATIYFYLTTLQRSHESLDPSLMMKPYFISMAFAIASAYCSIFLNRKKKHHYYFFLFVAMVIFAAFVFYQAVSAMVNLGNV